MHICYNFDVESCFYALEIGICSDSVSPPALMWTRDSPLAERLLTMALDEPPLRVIRYFEF